VLQPVAALPGVGDWKGGGATVGGGGGGRGGFGGEAREAGEAGSHFVW